METAWSTLENGFSSVGLGSPLARGVAMGALGGALEYTLKPSFSYKQGGAPRPWILFSTDPDATPLPPGSLALLTGVFFALFV